MQALFIKVDHELSAHRCRITIQLEGISRFEPNRIVYEIIGPDVPQQEPNGNFALAASLPTAMSLGRPLHVRGGVDADFLATMEECMAAWSRWRPDLFQPVVISADKETATRPSHATTAIMAFSGGLDSTFALHAHKHALLGRRGLDVQAAVLVQGFDIPLDDANAFEIARTHVQAILDSYCVRLNVVRTNWQKPFSVKWTMAYVLGIAAVLHLFHRQFGNGVFAADHAYDMQKMPWSSNAITNQMLGCGGFPIHSTGAAWSRTQKAAAVATNPIVLRHLRVCYERPELGGNCGECEKCFRTKLNFCAAGIHPIPAIGNHVTVADVKRIIPTNVDILNWYVEVLKRGTWPASDPIRSAVADLVNQLGPSSSQSFWQTYRAKKQAPPMLRAMRGALRALNPYRSRPIL